MLPQQYCLRWKYHHSNLQTMFSQLLDRGCFCDVTLACDGQTLKAHRVVLSACSTYFDSILTNCNSEKDPIVILKDVKFMDIKYLVEFMYKGEINVEHNNLASLLKTAEELRIKGLAEVSWRDDENNENGGGAENNDNNNNNVTESNASFPLLAEPTSSSSSSSTSSSSAPNTHHQLQTNLHQQESQVGQSTQSGGGGGGINSNDRKEYDNKENMLKAMPFLAPLSSPKDLTSSSSSTNRKKRGRPPLDDSNSFTKTPKYVHLINEQFYDQHESDVKDSAYDLSTTSSSTINSSATSIAATNHHLNRLMQEDALKLQNSLEERLNGAAAASTSRKAHKHLTSHSHPFTTSSNLVTVMMDENKPPHDSEDHSFYMPTLRRNENGHHLSGGGGGGAGDYDEGHLNLNHHHHHLDRIIPKVERADTPADLAEEEDNENIMCSPAEHLQSIFLTNEEREEWKDVIRMNDYLTKGRRPQFWEEPFTKRVLDAIKNKNLEMKKAAKLLGVSYGTLYGRYRETYGCLKHPYRGPPGSFMVSRMREMWPTGNDDQAEILNNFVQRSRMSMLQGDELNGAHLMEMMNEEAMLEHLAPNLAKFPRKMMNNLDMANLLKQVQSNANKIASPSHSISPPHHSTSPNVAIPSTSAASLLTPVASSNIDPSK